VAGVRAPRIVIPPCPEAEVQRLRRALGASAALAQVLVRRGLAEPVRARAFLDADEQHPAGAFAGIELALAPLLREIHRGGLITVHGDYDVDGVCSTAVLVRALSALGANVDWYLPDRAGDGYGLSAATVHRLAARGTRLLLTADCAITAVEEVRCARELGIEVVVSDHHRPRADGALPDAPIVHPAVCGYPFEQLCATAVAHKLAEALLDAARGAGVAAAAVERAAAQLQEDLDLVALATVADAVPLVGENRTLVRRGLRALARTPKPGLRALMARAGVEASRVDTRALGFALAPRINAAGRLYRADAGMELILTGDHARAAQVAEELERSNRERREIERGIRFEAEAQLAELGERPAYVLASDRWHPGVIGIVASRLAERSHRPVVLVALDGESGRGSGRSIEGFDLLAGLRACGEHLLRYGGHRAAAGLELQRTHLPRFAHALAAHAAGALEEQQLERVERVDAVVSGPEIGMELAEELQSLAPFGQANPPVSLLLDDATFTNARPIGEGRHVRFTVASGGVRANAVAFRTGGRLPVECGEPARATFALEVNEWRGVSEARLVLRNACALAPRAAPPAMRPARPPRAEPVPQLALFALP
jgi:single-stranded-DNA-specific exonuclease